MILAACAWLIATMATLHVAQTEQLDPPMRLVEAGVFASAFALMLWYHTKHVQRVTQEACDREQRLADHVERLEEMIETKLFAVVELNTKALVDNNAIMKQFAAARPCMIGEMQEKILAAIRAERQGE